MGFCPNCGSRRLSVAATAIFKVKNLNAYDCDDCKGRFAIGTVIKPTVKPARTQDPAMEEWFKKRDGDFAAEEAAGNV